MFPAVLSRPAAGVPAIAGARQATRHTAAREEATSARLFAQSFPLRADGIDGAARAGADDIPIDKRLPRRRGRRVADEGDADRDSNPKKKSKYDPHAALLVSRAGAR